ncbi:MAG: substrate-binding domain-containing protein [Muribaculaceae bacterium]|nr:substrate-binding domain-containing protein [Muribaculaceae bacterium]
MKFYLKYLLPLLLPLAVLLTNCSRQPQKWRIGVAQCSQDEWRSQMNEEIMREILFHDNATVEIRCADDSNERQIADIDYFIENGFDLIVVAPNESDALTPAVRKAFSKGIPVIIFDRAVNDSSFTTYIELDNAGIGRNAARYAANSIARTGGTAIEITGLPGSSPAEERHRGFTEIADSLKTIPIAGSFHADWKGERAFEITDSVLRADPDIRLIYAHNDIMAISAANAAKALGRDDITVIGTDGAPGLGIKAVADSVIDATFIYPTVGDRVVNTAIEILEGKHTPHVEHIPSQSFIDRSNADIHLKQNEVIRSKTNRIEELNHKFTLVRNLNDSQKVLLVVSLIAALCMTLGVVSLLLFLQQKNRLQRQLMEKNSQLLESTEKQNILYSRLQAATQAKLIFFTNVSHDLLTPLQLINEPLRRVTESDEISGKNRSLLQMVARNTASLRRMIEQILDFRKYENGKASLKLREKDAVRRVARWSERFCQLAEERGIKFVTSIHPDGSTMAVDTDKLERIFFNILSNAFKFTPPGGEIIVNCRQDRLKFTLEISDSGNGIPKDEIGMIFDRYYRTETASTGGNGIGLALTKAFVEMMDGKISVESTTGVGSTFTVVIPVTHVNNTEHPEAGNEAPDETDDAGSLDTPVEEYPESLPSVNMLPDKWEEDDVSDNGKPLLLVIDDNEDIRNWIKTICEGHYNVIEASDGKEGLRRAVKYVPDLVVCDIMMPGIDGLETTRRLKEEKTTSHIPVLILTASRLDEQRVKSYDSGADGFISKPFSADLFLSRCQSLILNRRRIFDIFKDNTDNVVQKQEGTPRRAEKNPPLPIDNEFYAAFIREIQERLNDENLSVKDIASSLGIGSTQLTRKIKALTHTTPVEIIRKMRMRKARHMLLTTDTTVTEIAYSLGFSSSQYFARCFKEEYGITPTDLRATVK